MLRNYLSQIYRFFIPHKELFAIQVDKTVVISMKNELNRREKIYKVFPTMKWSWFKGINGKELNLCKLTADGTIRNTELSEGELGVFLSHLQVWKDLLSSKDRYWLILESDILPSEKWKKNHKNLINKFIQEEEYDIFLIGKGHRFTNERDIPVKQFIVQPAPSWQAHAYVINRTGAEKLIESYQGILEPLDVWWWKIPSLKFLALSPSFLVQGGGISSTQDNRSK
jgi:GR25 family glycosyltransferase involved in LPS biosynthesis